MKIKRTTVREAPYIVVSSLMRIRAAQEVLRGWTPQNVANVLGLPDLLTVKEWQHTMRCLDTWRARLEWSMRHAEEPDKEPWCRQFPWDVTKDPSA